MLSIDHSYTPNPINQLLSLPLLLSISLTFFSLPPLSHFFSLSLLSIIIWIKSCRIDSHRLLYDKSMIVSKCDRPTDIVNRVSEWIEMKLYRNIWFNWNHNDWLLTLSNKYQSIWPSLLIHLSLSLSLSLDTSFDTCSIFPFFFLTLLILSAKNLPLSTNFPPLSFCSTRVNGEKERNGEKEEKRKRKEERKRKERKRKKENWLHLI